MKELIQEINNIQNIKTNFIKRYKNRKLYYKGKYITLKDIIKYIKRGERVCIYEYNTKKDVTNEVLKNTILTLDVNNSILYNIIQNFDLKEE